VSTEDVEDISIAPYCSTPKSTLNTLETAETTPDLTLNMLKTALDLTLYTLETTPDLTLYTLETTIDAGPRN
jgi:hypothetical protein